VVGIVLPEKGSQKIAKQHCSDAGQGCEGITHNTRRVWV
jgi:hypothetical protein